MIILGGLVVFGFCLLIVISLCKAAKNFSWEDPNR